jgi:hypothetical protein
MLIPRRTVRTSQPQHQTIVNGGVGWSAGYGLVPTTVGGFGRKSKPAALTSVGTVSSFVTDKTFTVVAIYACPLASQSAGQLRIGGDYDGIRLEVTTSAGGLNPVAWTATAVANLPFDVVGVSGFDDTPLVSIASCGPSDIKTWFGASGAGSSKFSGIYSHANTVAMVAPSNLNIRITGPAMDWYGVIVIPGRVSDAYAIDLIRNPWQIFEDEEEYRFIPAAGGGSVSLVVADALHGHAVDSPSFSMATYLAVAESLHTQAADNLTLNTTGSANLAIQEAAHAHVSDGVALTTRWLLIVADALHTHAADNLTMGVTGATTLTVADATSVHTADSVALSVIAFLAIADAVSQHAADNLTLDTSNATFLTVQEATHSHGTDGIALTLDTWLAIVDAAHAHTADAPTLSLGQLSLQIADALHAMYSDIVFLTLPGGNLTTDQKFIIRATARRLAAIGLARNNIINRRAS